MVALPIEVFDHLYKLWVQARKGTKLCRNCGIQVDVKDSSVSATPPVELIKIAPLAADLANCSIEILDVTAEDPENDGALRVTAKYNLKDDLATDERFHGTFCGHMSARWPIKFKVDECFNSKT